jgi:hypothetical protein
MHYKSRYDLSVCRSQMSFGDWRIQLITGMFQWWQLVTLEWQQTNQSWTFECAGSGKDSRVELFGRTFRSNRTAVRNLVPPELVLDLHCPRKCERIYTHLLSIIFVLYEYFQVFLVCNLHSSNSRDPLELLLQSTIRVTTK